MESTTPIPLFPTRSPALAPQAGDHNAFPPELPFRAILDTMPAGAYTCDADGMITYYNARAVEMWGRAPRLRDPADRFCGSFKLFSMDGEPLDHDECWMALVLRNNRPYEGHEIVVERPDGDRRVALAHAGPVHDDSGRLVGAVNVLVDITDIKSTQQALERTEEGLRALNLSLESVVEERTAELRKTNQGLEERNGDLEQFAYVASHDLQEPLRTVTSFVQLLELHCRDQLEGPAREYIAHAVEGARRMRRLVEDLLVYSRVGAALDPFRKVDVNAVGEVLLRDLAESIGEADADVRFADLPVVHGDPAQIRQLLQNLLTNALKFRQPGKPPRVEIRAEALTGEAAGWKFSVSDDGIGIDMEHSGRLFQMFQRLHARDEFEGTGIGLAICKRIAERHGGTIWLDSELGRGSTFHFTILSPD